MSTISLKTVIAAAALFASSALAETPRVLRTVHDLPRNQVWVLQHDAVYLHDASTQALKQRFELPGWIYARQQYACAPDLAVDARGVAVVSSNIAPIVWRIDPRSSKVTAHELTLDADSDKDIGFSGLAYAPDQEAFFAVSSMHGSLWRIDPLLRRAQKIAVSPPLTDTCGLSLERSKTRRTVVLCARAAQGSRAVHLAPDQRAAYVRGAACTSANEM